MKGLLVAGAASGVGKTTVTLALIAAMRHRGLTVQPFKGGPDFLDTGHHSRIAGRIARNLDTWMLSHEANKDVFQEAAHGADAVIVEGMMGLFDGKDGLTEAGSSAEIAKLLKLPVVLVLDASKSARSIAATVLGFESFDAALVLAGIILNRVANERHFKILSAAIASTCRTPVLGWLPHEAGIAIPERHLGLHTAEESDEPTTSGRPIDLLAGLAESHLNMDALLSLECRFDVGRSSISPDTRKDLVRIGVARDRAFCFYYEDNLELLRRNGAQILPFSPIKDETLPSDLDALYLGGGYPELYAEDLGTNYSMLESIRKFAALGRPIYAECGGMIYLSQQLNSIDGKKYDFAGVLPLQIEMTDRLVQFGYVTTRLTRDCLLGNVGETMRGHSFHYSRIVNHSVDDSFSGETSYRVEYSLSGRSEAEGYQVGNVLASYIHLHFRSAPTIARHFVEAIHRAKTGEFVWA